MAIVHHRGLYFVQLRSWHFILGHESSSLRRNCGRSLGASDKGHSISCNWNKTSRETLSLAMSGNSEFCLILPRGRINLDFVLDTDSWILSTFRRNPSENRDKSFRCLGTARCSPASLKFRRFSRRIREPPRKGKENVPGEGDNSMQPYRGESNTKRSRYFVPRSARFPVIQGSTASQIFVSL